ncbi:MAG: DEAD/DEAH box helicase family protein, partial [Candidatus Omnitrophota bacterium]
MKLKFDANLGFQKEAINSIVNIFEGQEICRSNFTVATLDRGQYTMNSDLGIGNRLRLLEDDILDNVRKIQLKNGLKQSEKLGSMDFTVEMETGTGKTYVYLRTIYELNKKYGFTKFIIVVPSIAIKEGVFKALEITGAHLKNLYDNVSCDFFPYDSQKLEQVRSFATADSIQIMVINIDAFRRSFTDPTKESKANIIHRTHDKLSGNRPIEFISATNPVVIIDEPQSVDTTEKAKEAIASLNPLCSLRYSATHREKYNLMYKLDSVDAYEQKLVKQIEVASVQSENDHNSAYIKLLSVNNKNGFTAKIEIDALRQGTARTVEITVKPNDDLQELSGGRDIYSGYIINDIYCESGAEYIDFTSQPDIVYLGQSIGGTDELAIKRVQIRKTIEEHLNKELRLTSKGIKILSLFFVDKVANYRQYDQDGNQVKGIYARIFEEEYAALIVKPKYKTLFEDVDISSLPEMVHNGYFSIDKKGKWNDTAENNQTNKDNAERAYHLIMKDKEKLLSFETNLKFIFSHSALKEGWDSPNVFQICVLRDSLKEMTRRQQIGRGLRISVNQDGDRVHGFDVNTLTVMANESYETFADGLQKEIEKEGGIRFGVVEPHTFAHIIVFDDKKQESNLGAKASEDLWNILNKNEYINDKGKVQDKLKAALKDGTVYIPKEYKQAKPQILSVLKKIAGKLNIKNADDKKKIELNKAIYLSDDFKELWNRIKHKTTYRVNYDVNELIDSCALDIKCNLIVPKTKLTYRVGRTDITRGGVEVRGVRESSAVYEASKPQLPDIVSYIQDETNLTRRTVVDILIKSGRIGAFKDNPQKFIDGAVQIIKRVMRQSIVDGIKYQKIGDEYYYAQELFDDKELFGYLSKNLITSNKSVYDHVVYDSDVEGLFADRFEKSEDVKLYAKLPSWFKIATPLGSYNPDWAVLVEKDTEQKLYFVIESKGTLFTDSLRPIEQAKIDCGKAHFAALDSNVDYVVSNTFDDFIERV